MWTLTFEQENNKYEVSYTGEGLSTDHKILDYVIRDLLPITQFVQATPTGPFSELTDLSVGYLAYAFVGPILSEYFDVGTKYNWDIQGEGYEWPQETEEKAVFSGLDYLRKKILEFANTCHDAKGQFCETPGAPGHEDHRGAPSDDKTWQAALDHKDTLNATQKAAIKWYGWAGSEYVNNHLRGTLTPVKNSPQKNEQTIKQMDKALESSPDLNEAILYRGVHGNSRFATEQLANAKVGDIYADDAYTSTTTNIKHSRFFTARGERVSIRPILVIQTKKTTKGLAVNEKEQEIILKRGTGLRVTGPSTLIDGYTLIPVEVIT